MRTLRKPILPLLIASLLAASPLAAQGIKAPPAPPPPLTEESMGSMPQNVVIVSGTAIVGMRPDVVAFNLSVITEGADIRKIVAANTKKVTAIINLLKAAGVPSTEIRASEINLSTVDDDRRRRAGAAGDVYRITSTVAVTRHGIEDIGELVAAAIDAGANEVQGPQFSVANEKAVQDRCIELAFADGRSKAEKLATLAGRSLGKVLAVTDGSSSPFEFRYRYGVEGGVLGGLAIEPGVHEVHCGVTAAFQLK